MILTLERGLTWEKNKDGSYYSSWGNTGLRISRSEERQEVWEFSAYHPKYYRHVTVHSSLIFSECERAAEIWMANH